MHGAGRRAIGRADFLRLGVLVAGGVILTGKVPAFAQQEADSAQSWVGKNPGRLPQTYREVVSYPESYRKAILQASSPRLRSQLWVEHLNRYRAAHPDLSAAQSSVIDRATKLAAKESTFDWEHADRPAIRQQLDDLKAAALQAFGHDEAYALGGVLGPSTGPPTAPQTLAAQYDGGDCNCSWDDDWCDHDHGFSCSLGGCDTVGGCGWFGASLCNGLCMGW